MIKIIMVAEDDSFQQARIIHAMKKRFSISETLYCSNGNVDSQLNAYPIDCDSVAIVVCSDGTQALNFLNRWYSSVRLAILDYDMPGATGLHVLQGLCQQLLADNVDVEEFYRRFSVVCNSSEDSYNIAMGQFAADVMPGLVWLSCEKHCFQKDIGKLLRQLAGTTGMDFLAVNSPPPSPGLVEANGIDNQFEPIRPKP